MTDLKRSLRRTAFAAFLATTTALVPSPAAAQPQFIAGLLLPLITSSPVFFLGPAAISAVAMGLGYAITAGALLGLQALLQPDKPAVPRPEDGKFNLKQPVPPLAYVLGRVKKGGDYVFLGEAQGAATHIICMAGHRINGFVRHYLHDEEVGLAGTVVTSPAHFEEHVQIDSRVGLDAETAYSLPRSLFPDYWTVDHRGDGLASIMMSASTVAAEDYQRIYPHQMPVPSSEIEGMRLYDPRTAALAYSENLALMRLWHLTHPVGAKLRLSDMYLPDWINAANVCDQTVTNRTGGSEPRYHGGFWFRANNNPVEVGRTIDQAAELVVYERPDGKVGVHAGEFVTPDIRLTENDISLCTVDANRRKMTNVVGVRGRYTDTSRLHTTVDAAIYGSPYDTEDERTHTLGNIAVQRHNHIARLQKLAYTRLKAPRVRIIANYAAAKNVRYRRFVRIHYPPKLDEAVIEIVGRVKLSLKTLQVEFEGIVVPPSLYAFDAATEEGAPGAAIEPIGGGGVPAPANLQILIEEETVGGGTAAYAHATWKHVSDALTYELEWAPTAGGAAERAVSSPPDSEVNSAYLADGVEYKMRARAWAVGSSSAWSDYQIVTAAANPTPPDEVENVLVTPNAGEALFEWDAPDDPDYHGARIWWNTVDDFATATLDGAPEYGAPDTADSRAVTLPAGTYYGWVQPINSAGVAGVATATGSFVVL